MRTPRSPRTVLFGVTIDYQLRYHDGLYQRLIEEGWEVHLVAGPGEIGERLGERYPITVHHIQMNRNPSPVADVMSLLAWIRVLRAVRPQVSVVGTPKAGLVGGIAAMLTGTPIRIYELHGLRLESATGKLRQFLRLLEIVACRVATHVVAVGASLRTRALDDRLAAEAKVRILGSGSPNGVEAERFARASEDLKAKRELRAELGIDDDVPIVTFVGRLTADKGLDALGRAMIAVERETGARLLVLGEVDDRSGRDIVALLRTLLSDVVFAGEVQDVAPYLAISDVFCLPSRREGLPTVVLEAFAARVPVVATRATGIVDLVEDGVTGRLVPIDSPEDLSVALLDVLSGNDRALRMVDDARTLVERQYSRRMVQTAWAETLVEFADSAIRATGEK